jgi:hypothetical protein
LSVEALAKSEAQTGEGWAELVLAWPKLPAEIRNAVMAFLRAAKIK